MKSLLDFENRHKVTLEKIEEWNYLRFWIGYYFNRGTSISDSYTESKKLIDILSKKMTKAFSLLKQTFFGAKHWFRKYDFIFFSDSNERKLINGLYKDKIADDIIDRLPGKTLLIELPNDVHYKYVYSKYITSESLLLLLSLFIKFFVRENNLSSLSSILSKEGIKVNLGELTKKFKSRYLVYKTLLKVYRPKAVFVNCSYCRPYLIKAAHDLNIKVVEIQHGVINDKHYGYVSYLNLNREYYPDILLSFGRREKKIKNLLINQVIPIGSYYLDFVKNNFNYDNDLIKLTSQYKVVFGVTLQDLDWTFKSMINFIKALANQRKDYLFILIPRKRKVSTELLKGNKNIIVREDFYKTIMHCHIHVTLYSTCCLEAPYLGVPNILINTKSFASKHYKNLLPPLYTKIVDTTDEFFRATEELLKLNKDEIVKCHKDFFVKYENNIKKAVPLILSKINKA